jgi:peptide/nickel transport system substrate-binding protein
MLAERVAAGSLPPVDERLPLEPCVTEVAEEIGIYGGTVRGSNTQPGGYEGWLFNGFDGMTAIGVDGFTIIPNIASAWEIDEDNHTITLHLREGAKWSDGQPYTADDIMFWFDDIVMDPDITPTPDPTIVSAEKIDDYTVVLGYQDLNIGARLAVHWPLSYAKHYHSQFHPRYVDEARMAELVEEFEVASPGEILSSFKVPPGNLLVSGTGTPGEVPMMGAYFLKARDSGVYDCERNPYYWKVDSEGNQLPYIDSSHWGLVQDAEALKLGVVAGDYDWEGLHSTLADYPLYAENAEAAGIRIMLWPGNTSGNICLQFNQLCPDEAKRELFSNVEFRRAMSLGLDRDEFNKTLFLDQGLIQQATQLPGGDYYVEEAAQAYLEFNPDEANRMLDELGLNNLDADGFRTFADGSPLTIIFEYADFSGMGASAELVADMWRTAVHVNIQTNLVDTNLLTEHRKADLLELSCMTTSRNTALQFAPFYSVAGIGELEYGFGYGWGIWHNTNGESGVEPPEEMKLQQQRWTEMQTAPTEERIRLGQEINISQGENLWSIGTVGLTPTPVVVSARLGNIPENLGLYAPDAFFACPARQETGFFRS